MFEQGVQTGWRRNVGCSKACSLQSMIWTTYPDRICYRPGVMFTNVMCFSLRGRIALRRLSPWGIRMELIRIAWRHGTFHIRNSVHQHFTSGYLTVGWERRTFQLLRSDLSGSSDSAYPESFSLSIQYHGVLLKLPDIFDRHFTIFWDILLKIFDV